MKAAATYTEDGHKRTINSAQQYKPKVAKSCTECGHKKTTKTSTTI